MGAGPSFNVWVVYIGPPIPGWGRYILGRIFHDVKPVEMWLYENGDRGDGFQGTGPLDIILGGI